MDEHPCNLSKVSYLKILMYLTLAMHRYKLCKICIYNVIYCNNFVIGILFYRISLIKSYKIWIIIRSKWNNDVNKKYNCEICIE